MTETLALPYLAPVAELAPLPLGRHFPQCFDGQISRWLNEHSPKASWVLDPFGSTPATAIQAAQAGYRVLAAVNNPLLAFALEMLCKLPTRNVFQSALAELAFTRRGETHLEALIQSFYLTPCASCGREIPASAFIWKRNEKAPYARVYQCPHCGDGGLHPATEADASRLAPLLRSEPLHWARAVEKVISADMAEEEKRNVEEALKVYPVRSLAVLVNLLNKLDTFPPDSESRRLLQVLLLPVLDAGTNLWPYPETAEFSHTLQTPSEYIEKNLWFELESAIDLWQHAASPLDCSHWPDIPQQAGICIYPGRVKELLAEANTPHCEAVVCILPRPSQAFWTLSALWSAWLWGKEVNSRYVGVLARRRFDWHWHTRALHSPLEAVNLLAPVDTPVLGLLDHVVPGFILSTTTAAASTGLAWQGVACKTDHDEVQFQWTTTHQAKISSSENRQDILRQAVRSALLELGEPVSYIIPYTAALVALARHHLLPAADDPALSEKLSEVQTELMKLFMDRAFLHHYESNAQELEPGSWYLENPENNALPLDDRVEREVVKFIQRNQSCRLFDLQQYLYAQFPGLLTPSDELVQACLESYAELSAADDLYWLKPEDAPSTRKTEIQQMNRILHKIAGRIGLQAKGEQPLVWMKPDNDGVVYRFFIGASAILHPHTWLPSDEEDVQNVYVFPASRSLLIQTKLALNPRLREKTSQNWHFLKFRYLQALSQRAEMTLELWQLLLDGDPLDAGKDTQLSVFI